MTAKDKLIGTLQANKPTLFIYGMLVIVLVVAEIITPGYLSMDNLSNVLRQAAFLGIVAAGQTLVIITAGTDLSVSYLVTLGNVLSAQIMGGSDANIPLALFVVALTGLAVGFVNGAGVHFLKIPSLVMTLGMGSVLQGIVFIYTKGAPKGNTAPLIQEMVSGKVLGTLSPLVFLWIAISILTIFLLKKTVFGRNTYNVGENLPAALRAGVPVGRTLITVYMICGLLSAITGMILVGYTGTSYLDAGTDYQMNSIAAVVMGGTLLSGGKGDYIGTIAGTIIICVLMSVLNIVQMPTFGRHMIRGAVILIILMIFGLQSKEK